MRFKSQLGIHAAWRNGVTVPASLLTHYRAVGLDNNSLAYVLQIIAAYWRDEEANHSQIADVMGCSERVLRKYNGLLQDSGLADINGRYMHGNRLENDYDLTPLFDMTLALDKENEQQQAKVGSAYRIIDHLVEAIETGADVTALLKQLAYQWRENDAFNYERTGTHVPVETGTGVPVETGTGVPVETGTGVPVETGTGVPVSIGTHVPVSIGTDVPNGTRQNQPEQAFRLKQEQAFLSVVVVPPNNKQEETTTNNNIMGDLEAMGIANGDAKRLLKNASKHFGENALDVVNSWLDYCGTQENLHNPAGLIIKRIKDGETPPIVVSENLPAVESTNDSTPALLEI